MNDNQKEFTLARERLHWGIFIPPLLLLVLMLLAALAMLFAVHLMNNLIDQLNPRPSHSGSDLFFLLAFLPDVFIGLPLLLVTWATYAKSEITLTNRRIHFRTGFIMRVAGEVPLENVEAIIIAEPLLGRVFGYGTVILTSVGGLRFPLRYIASPQNFYGQLQQAVKIAKAPVAAANIVSSPRPDDHSRYMPKA